MPRRVDFLTFFLIWARFQGWEVPLLHVRICLWLDTCKAPERVLLVFRGAAKSTIYAVFKAYRLYLDRTHRSLVWSADGPTAGALTADVINVLRNHPLCRGMLPNRKPAARRFWVIGSRDARNASMRATGVEANATSARADAVDFDDVEVPENIGSIEGRLRLRQRISESTHIAVPGAQKTYIGTPHTYDSIYPERIKGGAEVLKIPLFEHRKRYVSDTNTRTRYPFSFPIGSDGLYVFTGIHEGARLLVEGVDYALLRGCVVLPSALGAVVDIYAGCAWPERFDRADLLQRRRETRTLNAWDSQYFLEAKPITDVRLDPEKLRAYDVEPVLRWANRQMSMWLGNAQIVGASCRWDPANGKLKSDVSSLAVVLQDAAGNRYWHRAVHLTGNVSETNDDGSKITGGQVLQIVSIVRELKLSRVVIETNGAGTFAGAHLKTALKQARLRWSVGVSEMHESKEKNGRIVDQIEPLLLSNTMWAHVSVLEGPAFSMMRNWNPAIKHQPDDDLDSLAGAISDTPERIGRGAVNGPMGEMEDWRPGSGTHSVTVEHV